MPPNRAHNTLFALLANAMSNESLPEPEPVNRSSATSLTYRPQDRLLYGCIGAYLLLAILVMGNTSRSSFIQAGIAFGLFIPVLLLFFLVVIQISRQPRFSPMAFIVALLAVILSGFFALVLAGEASAAC
jgi:hypothetical protein